LTFITFFFLFCLENILNQEERVTVLKQLSLEENQKAREIQKIYEEKSKKLQDLMKV